MLPGARSAHCAASAVPAPYAALAQSHRCSLAWNQSTIRASTWKNAASSGSIQLPPSPSAITCSACRSPRRSASTRASGPNALTGSAAVATCVGHQFLRGSAAVGRVRAVARQIAADRQHLLFTPATAGRRVPFTALIASAIHPDHQQRHPVGRAGRTLAALVVPHLRIAPGHHRAAQRLRPAAHLLGVQRRVQLPVDGQRPRRRLEPLLRRRLASEPGRRLRRQRRLGRQRPLTILRGKKTGHRPGSGTAACPPRPARAG